MPQDTTEKLLYTIPEACAALGHTRTRLYALLGTGNLAAVKSGRRTLVTRDSMVRLIATLPAAGISAPRRRDAA